MSINNQRLTTFASIEECKKIEATSLLQFTCNWSGFWDNLYTDFESIIKLHYQNKILGLIHLSFYSYSGPGPDCLEIVHLECLPIETRLINPIGQWLIWYAIQIALHYCTENQEQQLITLDSLEDAIPYYRDKIKMEPIGWTSGAPGENLYAFRFTTQQARQFCIELEREYGQPLPF